MNIDPETGKERDNKAVPRNHGYTLRPRPTKSIPRYALTQINNQNTIPKPHAHIMMMQMNIKEGIKKFGDKGSNLLLKERQALCAKEKRRLVF